MKIQKLLQLFIIGYLVEQNQGAKLMRTCSEDDRCPPNSSCIIRGCEGNLCICNNGLMPSDDYANCLEIVEIGKQCGTHRRCRGLSSRCNETNICECQSGYIPSSNRKYCKQQPILGTSYSLLGEECDGDIKRCIDINTECVESVCVCKTGYRKATNNEINAYPFNIVQCVPNGFGLDVKIQPSDCFTPFEIASISTSSMSPTSSAETTISPESSVLSSLSSVSTKQTSLIAPTSSSESLENIITETSTLLSVNVSKILSTEEMVITASPLTTLQTHSPSTENMLSNIVTNLPTDANTISSLQTKSETIIIDPSTSEFEMFVTSTYTSTPPLLPSSSSEVAQNSVYISSSFTNQIVKTSLTSGISATPDINTIYVQSSIQHMTATIRQSTERKHQISSSSLDLEVGSQIISPLPFTNFVSSPSYYFTDSSATTLKTSSIPQKSSVTSSPTTLKAPSSGPMSSSHTYFTDVMSILTSTTPRTVSVTIHRHCNAMTPCPENAECEMDLCGEYRCRCRIGYVENSKSTLCLKLVQLGDNCDHKTVCLGGHSKCTGSTCVCDEGYELTSNKKSCRKQKSWFISFPLLEDECQYFFADCYNENEQICLAGTCNCKMGLRKKALEDMEANYNSALQCINESLVHGYREADVCRGQSRRGEQDQNEDEAARKVRIMKGSIIGGVMALIVLVASVIGIICFIRYRRRTMIKDMVSDHGSVASFDRRSSGKYSFKLPRPFRLFTGGEKEYESEHINYDNSVYETHDEPNNTHGTKQLETQRSNGPFTRTLQLEDIDFGFNETDRPS